jgi:hypothetical protein
MMWKPIFKFSTTILLLLFSIACQPSVKFSSEPSNRNSAINSEGVSDEKRVSQEKRIAEELSSQRGQKEKAESRESLQSYIGLIHPPLPDELKNLGGFLTGTGDDSEYPYSVNLIQKGSERMIWLDLPISQDENERAVSKVVDVAPLPSFDKNPEIVIGGSSNKCSINGEYDPNLIALAKLEDGNTEYLTKIRKAWQIDPIAGKFKDVSLESLQIQCQNVNFGI